MKLRHMTLLAYRGAPLLRNPPAVRAWGRVPARVRKWVSAPFRAREQGKTLPAPRNIGCDRMKERGYFK